LYSAINQDVAVCRWTVLADCTSATAVCFQCCLVIVLVTVFVFWTNLITILDSQSIAQSVSMFTVA